MKTLPIENFLKMNPQIPQYSQKNQNFLIAGVNPISYLDDGSQEEQIAPLAASVDWSQITPSLVSGYSETNKDTDVNLFAGSVISYGQSFLNTNSGVLSQAKFWMKETNTGGIGNVYVKIYAHTGTFGTSSKPTGSPLATSDAVSFLTIAGTYAFVNFTFSGVNKITLAANTNYVAVVEFNAGDAGNYVTVGVDASAPTAPGNASYSSNNTVWTSLAGTDMCFNIYSGGTSATIIEGNIVHMIPSTEGTYSAYAITDTTKVYGITTSGVTDLGYPTGSSNNNSGGYLAIGANYLFMTFATGGAVYKMALASGAWSSFGTITVASGVHIMEPFLDFIAVRDGSASYTNGGIIKKIDVSAFTVSATGGIDLGSGWGIMQMRNLNNKYLAIAGGRTSPGGTTNGYPQNYIFLWDGISSRYNYSAKVPGQFIDMKVVDSILYVAVKVSSGKTVVYYLNGTKLTKLFTTQLATIYGSAVIATPWALFDFKNYLGIHLNTTNNLTDPLVIYGKDEVGDIEFIHSSNRRFEIVCPGYDGSIFATYYVVGGFTTLYYLPLTGSTYQQILYKSQWIPVKNLQAIDIYHDSIPVSGTDAIKVTIDGQGEDIISGSVTINLADITPTNYLTIKRTRLDVNGFTGDQLRITLSTINSTWRPIIRAIVPIVK